MKFRVACPKGMEYADAAIDHEGHATILEDELQLSGMYSDGKSPGLCNGDRKSNTDALIIHHDPAGRV
jgi:hypothetical protein